MWCRIDSNHEAFRFGRYGKDISCRCGFCISYSAVAARQATGGFGLGLLGRPKADARDAVFNGNSQHYLSVGLDCGEPSGLGYALPSLLPMLATPALIAGRHSPMKLEYTRPRQSANLSLMALLPAFALAGSPATARFSGLPAGCVDRQRDWLWSEMQQTSADNSAAINLAFAAAKALQGVESVFSKEQSRFTENGTFLITSTINATGSCIWASKSRVDASSARRAARPASMRSSRWP
jgi:hypothetical protein